MEWLAVGALLVAVGLGLAGLVIVAHLLFAARNRVPYVMTPDKLLPEIVAALKLPREGTMYDLGCGNGRVLEAVGRAAPGLRLVGVENNPVALTAARMRLGGGARLEWGEIQAVRLQDTDRVFVYLGPGLMEQLESRFERELRPGTRVVSVQFPLPHRRPAQEIVPKYGKPYANRIYVYEY